jgi:diadenosine tetraphosphatase ApaH/serine/threonine PP2A family protein phosphatase
LKIAYISDIHSNLEALEVALTEIARRNIKEICCLGDIVGYGADPDKCVDRIREVSQKTIAGNHDFAVVGLTSIQYFNSYAQEAIRWTTQQLSETNKLFIKGLPLSCSQNSMFCVHATPSNPQDWDYIFSREEAERQFKAFKESICFIGHSHIPAEFQSRNKKRRIINIGSIGQPRDRDPRLSFVIYDSESHEIERIRLEYDVETASAKIRKAGLPEFLAERLLWGM